MKNVVDSQYKKLYYQENKKKGDDKIKKEKTTKEWLPFVEILDNGVIKFPNYFVKIIKVFPINYNLKSNLEKEAILNSYKVFLKTCDFNIQILIQSKKENLSKHISNVQKSVSDEKNPKILEISEKYINYIKMKNEENRSSSKNFYIVIRSELNNLINGEEICINNLNDNYFKIKETLSKVGNRVIEIKRKEDIEKILMSFYNQRIIQKQNQKGEFDINFKKGVFKTKDKISPSYVDNTNPKYFSVDNLYYSGLIIVDYYREYTDIIFKTLVSTNINLNFTCFYEKQDTYKTIKDLTYYIGNVGVDLNSGNTNREDIDIAAYSYNDAKYIRKEMQVNNEDLYYIYTYVIVYSETKEETEYLLNKVEGILNSSGLIEEILDKKQYLIHALLLWKILKKLKKQQGGIY